MKITPPKAALHGKETTTGYVIRYHFYFAVIALGSLLLVSTSDGMVLALVIGWHVGMLWNMLFRSGTKSSLLLWDMYTFSSLTSIFQVLPDWFLVKSLQTLEFPTRGTDSARVAVVWSIGQAVPCYMAGMWAIPFFLILTATAAVSSSGSVGGYWRSALVSLLIFGSSEYLLYFLDLWRCTDRVRHRILGHVAVYVLPAEAILGPVLLHHFWQTRGGTWTAKLGGAIVTMLCYTGSLALCHLLMEGGR
ncbi:expressed unknown protein [Seminavis robusta]|uniref:DUF6989 domain-containing protein n=1 Tax=Seminavis robusta TaxID=568900 RepID=A0A9N8E4A6_9STRA|nr:expressed unknown protein [Seminavis robusta]|eukprot:Sro508_g156830.1 n/a (248) ;mRNA; f:43621-44364